MKNKGISPKGLTMNGEKETHTSNLFLKSAEAPILETTKFIGLLQCIRHFQKEKRKQKIEIINIFIPFKTSNKTWLNVVIVELLYGTQGRRERKRE
jgi:hypothetical protein